MQILQQTLRRPAFLPVVAITLTALLATVACGSAAQPEPTLAPVEATESSHTHAEGRQPPDTAASADAVVINMAIAARAGNLSRDDLQVKKGDNVSINFTADEPGEIHIHGYDLTAPVSPGSPGALNFVADTAGAFGINFHVFAAEGMESNAGDNDHHSTAVPDQVISEAPVSVKISAEPDTNGGVHVRITVEGFRFAPDLVDQDHTPGAGHAHIYLDGEKLGRVFADEYHIAVVPPGKHEIRVSLNTNNHSALVFDGEKVAATATVTVPDVGQGHGDGDRDTGHEGDGHDHDGHDHNEQEVVAEVHLGNLEVYP